MRIYLANAMAGEPNHGFDFFFKAADCLRALGHEPVSPADEDIKAGLTDEQLDACVPGDEMWWERLRHDATLIPKCDGIAFGPKWRQSRGARLERQLGLLLRLPFYRIDPDVPRFGKEKVVGIAGVARSGKDSAAQGLVDKGWTKTGYADLLKKMALGANPVVLTDSGYKFLADVVADEGWEEAKKYSDVRTFLQRLGTEGGRYVFGEEFWVDALFSKNEAENLVVSDVRFPNEAHAIESRGGVVIRVRRPGVEALNDHPSEHAMDDYPFAYEVKNTGTMSDLHESVSDIVADHYGVPL